MMSPNGRIWGLSRGHHPVAVRKPVAAHVSGRQLGFLGQDRVNVVRLNADLAALGGRATPPARRGQPQQRDYQGRPATGRLVDEDDEKISLNIRIIAGRDTPDPSQ